MIQTAAPVYWSLLCFRLHIWYEDWWNRGRWL